MRQLKGFVGLTLIVVISPLLCLSWLLGFTASLMWGSFRRGFHYNGK